MAYLNTTQISRLDDDFAFYPVTCNEGWMLKFLLHNRIHIHSFYQLGTDSLKKLYIASHFTVHVRSSYSKTSDHFLNSYIIYIFKLLRKNP